MPPWQKTKLAWCIYTYVMVGEADGVDFVKWAKDAAKKAMKCKHGKMAEEEAPTVPAAISAFELPTLRNTEWPDGCHEAALLMIEDLCHRFGTMDLSKKQMGGIISNANRSFL